MNQTIEQEKPLKTAKEQLPLPFPPRFLIDECVPQPWNWKEALEKTGANVATVHEHELLGKGDDIISTTAKRKRAWVVTKDYKFHYEAVSHGVSSPNIVWIEGNQPLDTDTLEEAVGEITKVCYSFATEIGMEQSHYFIHYDLNTGKCVIETCPPPPPDLLKVLPLLKKKSRGLANVDLRDAWNCNASTAWRKAKQLVLDGWLHEVGKTKGRRYFEGPRLERFVALGRLIRREEGL